MESDNEQLKLLEILHYVWMVLAGMSLVAGVIEYFLVSLFLERQQRR
jgi:hypothetical protein